MKISESQTNPMIQINTIKEQILFIFLVLNLIIATIIVSTSTHELLGHGLQVISQPNGSTNDISEVCVAGWTRERPTANGWLYYERDSNNDPEHLDETIPYIIQGITMCIYLILNTLLLHNYIRGNN